MPTSEGRNFLLDDENKTSIPYAPRTGNKMATFIFTHSSLRTENIKSDFKNIRW
jgi:hypothetical protein